MFNQAKTLPATTTGAEAIVQILLDEGVEVLFGYPGGAIMPTYDALLQAKDRIRHILVRHEQGAAHAAQGYARATGNIGVCIATSGPGATNMITALADALMDSTPLVCITGQVVSTLLGSDAFQEADVVGMTTPATKWNYQITEPGEVPLMLSKAFAIARAGRPGPVLIDITKDAQLGTFDPALHWPLGATADLSPVTQHYASRHDFTAPRDLSRIEQAAELINQAQRPYLLLGQGVSLARAEGEVTELAERAGIPVAATLLGLSAFPTDHPLYVGMLGMHGNYSTNVLTNEADVIIAIGMRFDDRVTGRLDDYARQAKIIHLEIDPAEVNKNVRADIALIGDAKAALMGLLPAIEPNAHLEWLSRFRRHETREYEQVIRPELHPGQGPLKMGEVVDRLSRKTRGDAIIISDVGQHQMLAARYYRFRYPLSHITSGGLGTMGFALPAAIGAKLGVVGREVIAIMGDGGFQMTLQELGTIMQEGIGIKMIIMNNSHLGMVRQWQELFFAKRYASVALHNPDFITICQGYGIHAWRVSERRDLDAAIERLLASPGPCLLEVVVGKEDNVFPMIEAGASVSEIRLG